MSDDTQGVQPQAPTGESTTVPAQLDGSETPHTPPPAYAPAPRQGQVSQPVAPSTKGPVWLALFSLIAGVVGIVVSLVPGPYTARIIYCVAGILLAGGGVVLGIMSFQKKWRKGLALSGLIVSGFAFLFSAAFLALGLVANYQIEARVAQNNADTEAHIAEEKAAEDARFAKSEWLEEERQKADLDAYVELDAATLTKIADDPASFEGQEFVLKVTMGEPLITEILWSEGLCMAAADGLPVVGQAEYSANRIALLDRGGEDACPIADLFFGGKGEVPSMGSLTAEHLVWVSPSGTTQMLEGEEVPVFVVVHVDE